MKTLVYTFLFLTPLAFSSTFHDTVYFDSLHGEVMVKVTKNGPSKSQINSIDYSFEIPCHSGCNISSVTDNVLLDFQQAVINQSFYRYEAIDNDDCPGSLPCEVNVVRPVDNKSVSNEMLTNLGQPQNFIKRGVESTKLVLDTAQSGLQLAKNVNAVKTELSAQGNNVVVMEEKDVDGRRYPTGLCILVDEGNNNFKCENKLEGTAIDAKGFLGEFTINPLNSIEQQMRNEFLEWLDVLNSTRCTATDTCSTYNGLRQCTTSYICTF